MKVGVKAMFQVSSYQSSFETFKKLQCFRKNQNNPCPNDPYLYIFQVATGKLRRKMNQCREISINTVTMVWPINSGITH